jgi:tetratricopeptide (TPR) repeat protein
MMLAAGNKLAEAEPLYREALDIRRRALPAGHQDIAGSLVTLASLLREQGKLDEAEQMAREGLEMYRKALPAGHPNTAIAINTLARVLHRRGKYADAEPLYREAVASYQGQFGNNHLDVGMNRLGLGVVLGKMNRLAESETELLEADRVLASAQGASPGARLQCYEALAAVYALHEKSDPGQGYGLKAAQWSATFAASRPPATTQSKVR